MSNKYPVNLKVRPVLPMIMRGMKIHPNKGKYVLSDAAREGRKYGTRIKNIYSPIGAPARKAYSLFEIIDKNNKGFDFLEELTKASFFDGINIGDEKFLEKLIIRLDLSWREVKAELNNDRWKDLLDENLKNMYAGNSWGVPTLKLTNKDGSDPYYKWGQDRLWLIENEIVKRMN
jgi:2-hydroxychromene-2-carboxylate isomerase